MGETNEDGSSGCPVDKFDFANAFTGTLGGIVKFKRFGQSVREEPLLGVSKLTDLFNPVANTN